MQYPGRFNDLGATIGPVIGLGNNAGIPAPQRAHRMTSELVNRLRATNLTEPFLPAAKLGRHTMQWAPLVAN